MLLRRTGSWAVAFAAEDAERGRLLELLVVFGACFVLRILPGLNKGFLLMCSVLVRAWMGPVACEGLLWRGLRVLLGVYSLCAIHEIDSSLLLDRERVWLLDRALTKVLVALLQLLGLVLHLCEFELPGLLFPELLL